MSIFEEFKVLEVQYMSRDLTISIVVMFYSIKIRLICRSMTYHRTLIERIKNDILNFIFCL